jgi:hypothetical protein
MTKVCSKCGINQPLNNFYKSKNGYRFYCKKCDNDLNKISYQKRKQKVSEYGKIYREENKEKISKRKSIKYIEVIKPLYNEKKDHINKRRNKRYIIRIQNDLEFKIEKNCRGRIQNALKRNLIDKKNRTTKLLGCDIEFLKHHLELQFKDGMNWNNYGLKGWHIDHIRPCASFDLTKEEQQKECFHYTNLQPLWAEENLKKGSKIL